MSNLTNSLNAFVAVFGVLIASGAAPATGATVFRHIGNNDPVGEGWIQTVTSTGVSGGPLTNDLGLDAWFTADNNSNPSDQNQRTYHQTPTSSEFDQARTQGWALRAVLRVVDIPDGVGDGSIQLNFEDAGQSVRWKLTFGSHADGSPIVRAVTGGAAGIDFTVPDPAGGYHLYELVFDPLAGSADLFVDGVERISDYTGSSFTGISGPVLWGASQGGSTGTANWNLVEFQIGFAPDPVVCDAELSQESYTNGETVTASVARLANTSPDPVAVEIKGFWADALGAATSLVNDGADGSLVLPPGFDIDLAPLNLFVVDASDPTGTYEAGCRVLDPVTGKLLTEDLDSFEIQ